MGRSLLDKLDAFVETSLSYGNDIDERISGYNDDISDYATSLIEFQIQIDALQAQYTNQFATMDAAVANLNKTKESLTMMMDGWKAMNN
jgi:flagellar capping protein FliD